MADRLQQSTMEFQVECHRLRSRIFLDDADGGCAVVLLILLLLVMVQKSVAVVVTSVVGGTY